MVAKSSQEKATQAGFAELVGMSKAAMARHMKYLPEGGTYGEWLHIYCHRQREVIADRGCEGPYELSEERARLAHHQANKLELEVKELRNLLVRADEAAALWNKSVEYWRERLLELPNGLVTRILSQTDHASAKHILEHDIYEVLMEFSKSDSSST